MVESSGLGAPQPAQDFHVRPRALVTLCMGQDVDPHHAELFLAPSADHVETPSALADTIERRAHLGGDQRMKDRDVDRRIDCDALARGQQRCRPRHGLQRSPEVVRLTAKTAPSAHREQQIESRVFGRKRDGFVRIESPVIRHRFVGVIETELLQLGMKRPNCNCSRRCGSCLSAKGQLLGRSSRFLGFASTTRVLALLPPRGAGEA